MKIRVFANKPEQYFFYLYHLCDWHYSSISDVAFAWVKQTNPLSKEERVALSELKRLFKKYSFGKHYLGTAFTEKSLTKAYVSLENIIGKNDAKVFRVATEALLPRINLLWEKDASRIKLLKEEIDSLVKSPLFFSLVKPMELVFGTLPKVFDIVVCVYPLNYEHIGGSANTPDYRITVEFSNPIQAKSVILVALHELTHKIIRDRGISFKTNKKILPEIKERIPHFLQMTKEEALEEIFLLGFLPDGYLAKKHNVDIQIDPVLEKLPNKAIALLKNIITYKKRIDKQDIKNFISYFTQ